eukprot:8678913-Karenia_brevis.AAC.1
MERHGRTSIRRSPSHKANRNKKDPFSTSATNPTPTMMPSLGPEGPLPKNAISGKKIKAAHISMVNKWKAKGQPMEPTVIQRSWEDVAKERWGVHWGTIEPMALATTMDYMDTHANKYQKIMGKPPPSTMALSQVPKQITPLVYWSGAQYYLNNTGQGTKIAIIDNDNHLPVGASHVMQWMVYHGDAVAEYRKQGPAPSAGTAEWERTHIRLRGCPTLGRTLQQPQGSHMLRVPISMPKSVGAGPA